MPSRAVIKKSALSPTVLVAGGAGFIGSYLCDALIKRGARVIALDNFKTGKKSNVAHLLDSPQFALYEIDINVGLPPEIESVDYIFHIAGFEDYLYSKNDVSLDTLLTNGIGTKNLLDLTMRSGAKFLFASSVYVYEGNMSQVDLNDYFGKEIAEERRFSHREAKRYAEALVGEYLRKNGVDVRIVRLGEVYGPKMDMEAVTGIGGFISDLIAKKNLVIHGDGNEKEFFTYIDDAVSGIVKALFTENTKGKIYSIVNHEPYSILETAFLFKSLAQVPVDVEFKPGKSLLVKSFTPDVYNLKEIDWSDKTSLKEGISKTLKYFGYEPNEHSFKPSKLLDNRRKYEEPSINTLSGISDRADVVVQPAVSPKLPWFKSTPQPAYSTSKTEQKPPTTQVSFESKPKAEVVQKVEGITSLYKVLEKSETSTKSDAKLKLPSLPSIPKIVIPKFGGFNFNSITIPFLAVSLGFILTFIIFPSVMFLLLAYSSEQSLVKVQSSVAKVDLISAKANASIAVKNLTSAQKYLWNIKWLFALTGQTTRFNTYSSLLSSATLVSDSFVHFSDAVSQLENFWQASKPDNSTSLTTDTFVKIASEVDNAKYSLKKADANMKQVDTKYLPISIQQKFDSYTSTLASFNKIVDTTSVVLPQLSEIMGMTETKKYLILFQNPTELRPTGGFIGSYAVLTITKGKIADLFIDDIYNPDGQLDLKNIKVQPPKPIADFLAEDTLNIRNANWNPNFPDSAEQIVSLYQKATGDKISGVLAVDLYFVQGLLKVMGPVYLTAYNEEINADNLYAKAQFYSEFNYTAGSTQKKAFLTTLGGKILERFFSDGNDKMFSILNETLANLQQRHIQAYFINSPVNSVLDDLMWSGSLVNTSGDYLSVINANLGGNKANYFVQNKIAYSVSAKTRDGLLRGELTLNYKHTGTDKSWPGGDYKDYVRILTPLGTKLTGAVIKQAGSEDKDIFQKMIIAKVGNLNSFETSFVLAPQSSLTLVLTYDLAQSQSITDTNKSYSLYVQKQAGTNGDGFDFTFVPPLGLKVMGKEIFTNSGDLNTDKQFTFALK